METRDIVFIALFAAIVAVLGAFPPIVLSFAVVPITAQSLGPMLAGGILGARRGALSMALFVLLIALGLPLLSGGRGGLGVFISPTGGYLLSWMLAAFSTGWIVERCWQRLNMVIAFCAAVFGGIVMIYAIGIPWSAAAAHLPLSAAATGALPFLVGDIGKALIAAVVIMSVKRTYPLIRSRTARKSPAVSDNRV